MKHLEHILHSEKHFLHIIWFNLHSNSVWKVSSRANFTEGRKSLKKVKERHCFSVGGRIMVRIPFPLGLEPHSPPPSPILSTTQPLRPDWNTSLDLAACLPVHFFVGMLSLFLAFPSHSSLRQWAPQACLVSGKATNFKVCEVWRILSFCCWFLFIVALARHFSYACFHSPAWH